MIPKTVVLPSADSIGKIARHDWERRHFLNYLLYIHNTAVEAGVNVETDPELKPYRDTAFPMYVDGLKAGIEYSDYSIVPIECWEADMSCFFMFQHIPVFNAYPNLGSFPPESFTDWNLYRALIEKEYLAETNLIIHPQFTQHHERRIKVRKILEANQERFNIDCTVRPQMDFWRVAQTCRASVHIPGSSSNMLDRGQLQLMALGVCTISPDIFTSLCAARAEPNVHYLCLRDDYSDLMDKIEWCQTHRDDCIQIGNNAKKLFAKHCTPERIWNYIGSRCRRKKDIPFT